MSTISLDLIPQLLAVAELGSFSKAAERLGVEKSSVSRAVARFEERLGERLFFRTTRRVSLTDLGRSVVERLRDPHASLEAALDGVLDAASQPRGKIVVTAPVDLGLIVMPEALIRFQRRYPHVVVELRLTRTYVDLEAAGVDAAIRISTKQLKDSSLKRRKLCDLNMALFASQSYADLHGLPRTLQEAASHRWVVFGVLQEFRLRGPDGTVEFRPPGAMLCDEIAFVQQAVLQGAGIGLLPLFAAEEGIRQGRLVEVLPRWSLVGNYPVWFLTQSRRNRESRALEGLRDAIADVLVHRRL